MSNSPLTDNGGQIAAELVRTFVVGSQTEGCAADDARGTLYLGEEGIGLWQYGAGTVLNNHTNVR